MDSRFQSVFLIKTPLQYLNALEALQAFSISPSDAALLLLADHKSMPQLRALIQPEHAWGAVEILSESPLRLRAKQLGAHHTASPFGNALFAIHKLRSLARTLPRLQQVVIGDLGNPLMRHFANSTSATVIVLDDGVATLKYARERSGSTSGVKPLSLSKRAKLELKRALLQLRDQPPRAVTFFSVYGITTTPPDRHVRNDFCHLRTLTPAQGKVEAAYFLGSPLVEAAILSENEYLAQLQAVQNALTGITVIYVRHRREDATRVERLCTALGWEHRLFDYPIEYQLAVLGPRPTLLASHISSALNNCHLLFGEGLPTRAYRLASDWFEQQDGPTGERIAAVYTELAQAGVEVVDLSPTR